MHTRVLGIDVGGSGIKGAIVDTATGKFVSERYRVKTPSPATPEDMARVIARVVKHFAWKGPVGCGMPGRIRHGRVMAASNLDKSWIGVKAHELYGRKCGRAVTVVNDADAAGLAEMKFGAGSGKKGVVAILTLGTGIGSAVFIDGRLFPNTELGQVEIRGKTAEMRASARVRKAKNLSWERWAQRLNEYMKTLELLISPDFVIIGGGVSRKASKFIPLLKTEADVAPAELKNEAGIIGAALSALHHSL